ncbi:MAG: efflux RND transporter permease subunit, partial [Bacteroidota bacterium]
MRSFLRFFLKYGIWSDALAILIVILGLVSLFAVKRSFFPEQKERQINIEVAYPGASPQEVEKGIVNRIEQELEGIEGIDEYKSSSSENLGSVNVFGRYDYNTNELLTDVKNAVDRINSFPENAEKPVVYLQKNIEEVITIILTSEEQTVLELKQEAERIEDALIAKKGISQVEIQGLPAIEISVEVGEDKLRAYNLSFEDIADAVRRNNLDLTAGEIEGKNEELRIRLREESVDADSIANIVVRTSDSGKLIRIKDIGTARRQFEDVPNQLLFNGKNAIAIRVNKLRVEDLLEITEKVKAYVEDYNARNGDTQLVIGRDRSVGLNQRISLLVENGAIGLLLVLVVLGLFLNLRLAMWVAIGIPISFFGMFIAANFLGITINMLSLFGMILVVGILVDDGIVIAENIYAKKERGYPPLKAAVRGTMEVWSSVLTSVSTTMVAFVPFFFIESTLGEFVSEMALVVILCLGFSLIEAGIILPAHLVHYNALKPTKAMTGLRNFMDKGIDNIRFNYYEPLVEWFLRWRW